MDEILHHFETMGDHCLLVFTGESPFQGFLGGAKWISPIHSSEPAGVPPLNAPLCYSIAAQADRRCTPSGAVSPALNW